MELTRQQQLGLKIAVDRYENKEKYTVISGAAGTGKTTLIKEIIRALREKHPQLDVAYTAYTGKATQVLSERTEEEAFTLHKTIYDSHPRKDGTFIHIPKKRLPYDILVIDEISMVPASMVNLILNNYNCHLICLGDNFQLPPIDEKEDNHLLDEAHVVLDEIVRQEEDSEIIQLATAIRNLQPIANKNGRDVVVGRKSVYLTDNIIGWADQILVATNKMREDINQRTRKITFGSNVGTAPLDGDKIICRRNYWNTISDRGNSLINGTIGTLKAPKDSEVFRRGVLSPVKTIKGYLQINEEETFPEVNMDRELFLSGQKSLDSETEYTLRKKESTQGLIPYEFDYGYAITTHRAQGSEWDNVLVIEESFPFDKIEHARWLYTAVTRARKKIILLR